MSAQIVTAAGMGPGRAASRLAGMTLAGTSVLEPFAHLTRRLPAAKSARTLDPQSAGSPMSEKASLLAEFAALGGPIELQLSALATERRVPILALGASLMRSDEAAPPIIELMRRAAIGGRLDDDEATLLFRGLHVLAGARHEAAFRPLLELLRRPVDELDSLLGDAITESLARIAASLFDGDADALFAAICDHRIDEFVRDALIGAASSLAADGRIEASAMAGFLRRFYDDHAAADGDHVWYGWAEAVALLGVSDLAGELESVFREGRVEDGMADYQDVAADLARTLSDPRDMARFRRAHLGYVEDALEELERWPIDDGEVEAAFGVGQGRAFEVPVPSTNPWRHVGRNDSCPCGSGKKAKKCCL